VSIENKLCSPALLLTHTGTTPEGEKRDNLQAEAQQWKHTSDRTEKRTDNLLVVQNINSNWVVTV
jgi:hypothetical protein